VLDDPDATAAFARLNRAHQTRRTAAENQNVE
jgi:hypothetical protein